MPLADRHSQANPRPSFMIPDAWATRNKPVHRLRLHPVTCPYSHKHRPQQYLGDSRGPQHGRLRKKGRKSLSNETARRRGANELGGGLMGVLAIGRWPIQVPGQLAGQQFGVRWMFLAIREVPRAIASGICRIDSAIRSHAVGRLRCRTIHPSIYWECVNPRHVRLLAVWLRSGDNDWQAAGRANDAFCPGLLRLSLLEWSLS